MKDLTFALLVLSVFSSCNKENTNDEPNIEIHSTQGCVDELSSQIVDIPYAMGSYEFLEGITIDNNYEDYALRLFDREGLPIYPLFLESNQFLGITLKNSLEAIKLYELFKQPLKDEIIVNGEEVRVNDHISCKSRISNKSTPQTRFFNAIKDSTYTIALFSHDSAYGTGYINVKDSTGFTTYLKDVRAGSTTGGGGYFPNLYPIRSEVTGRIFIVIYTIDGQPEDPPFTQNVDIRITN